MTDLSTLKGEMRRAMRARRAEYVRQHPDAALALRNLFLDAVEVLNGAVVSAYVACDYEIDPYPIMEVLHHRGHPLCLPVVNGRGEPLSFRIYVPGDVLVPIGRPPIPTPAEDKALVEPDLLITPLLAFDMRGNRLGQGAGYYDMTLIELRKRKKIYAVGVGYDCQRIDEVPFGALDAPLDKVITENQAYNLVKPT
jgi:5-formyltetrahydrofolate cyclo-ligase